MRVELQEREDGDTCEGELTSVTIGTDGIWFNLDDCAPPMTQRMLHMDAYKLVSITEPARLTIVEHKTGVGLAGINALIDEALKVAGIMTKTRELSLVVTKLEEAGLWLSKILRK